MRFSVLFLFLLPSLAAALIPSWVQPGVTVVYDGVSSGVQDGQPVNGVQALITLRVTGVSGNTVRGTVEVFNPTLGLPVQLPSNEWSCTDGQVCSSRFWVDPANPAGSVKGPNGEPYTEGGPVPYTSPFGGPAVSGTNVLYYQNPDSHVEYHMTYQARTGLVVAYAEVYPSQRTYYYFRSISADLSGYQPPATGNNNQANQGGNNGTGGTGATGGACPAGFALLAPLALIAIARGGKIW